MNGGGRIYSNLVRPVLFSLDPERAHRNAIRLGERLSRSSPARLLLRKFYDRQFEELKVERLGLRFPNPVGLAGGFDKHGHIYPVIGDIGFGHMEIGSVSLLPWRGNPSPTLLRLPQDGGLINRLGLNSEGVAVVSERLQNARFKIPTGINLVKTADPGIAGEEAIQDYLQCFAHCYPLGDFITLNLSCPNTAEGRTFEDSALLAPFLSKLKPLRDHLAGGGARKPVFVKLSPDLEDRVLDEILWLAQEHNIDGCVIANTTGRREHLRTSRKVLDDFGFGGLSGRPLKPYVQEMVKKVWDKTAGQFLIVACGGVGCDPHVHPAEEVWEYLKLGATLVQLHTGLIYRGPAIASMINQGLSQILKREKLPSLQDFLSVRTGQPHIQEPAGHNRRH